MGVVTVRMPEEMHQAIRAVAAKRHKSMNDIFCSLAEQYLKQESERDLYNGFGLLGNDPADASVDYAITAQSEVALRDE